MKINSWSQLFAIFAICAGFAFCIGFVIPFFGALVVRIVLKTIGL